jgi:hypothetical protein
MKRIAIYDADGNLHQIEADEVHMCAPTSKCIKFWATILCAVLVMGIGIFFMVFQGATGVYFSIGEALLALGVGVLIPSPNYKDVIPKVILTSRPVSPVLVEQDSGEDSLPEPTNPYDNTDSSDVIVDVRE